MHDADEHINELDSEDCMLKRMKKNGTAERK